MGTPVTSSWIKGMNKDLAISLNDNQHLYDGLDINLTTYTGESTGVIQNAKGNKQSFVVPDIQPVYALTITGTGTPSLFITTSAGVTGPLVLNISSQTDPVDIYNQIIASIFSTYIANGEFGVFYNNTEVIIIGYSLDPNPTISLGTGAAITTIVSSQTDLSIAGWGMLGEKIALITTSKNNISDIPVNTIGQIWLLNYDDATGLVTNLNPGNELNPFYHLKYSNILDLSLSHAIYKEVIGRVESVNKGAIYWTDNYNSPRIANLFNPQITAVPPGLLSWKPEVNMTTPVITGLLNGGTTKVGKYQFAYQLYSADGVITSFSPASALIDLTDEPFGTTDYFQFDGAAEGTLANKSVRIKVPSIDRRYDYIRFVVIKYEIPDVPLIYLFLDQPITSDDVEVVYTGNESQEPITQAEFTNPRISFDRCKSIAQKKNRLYPANTKTNKFILDWDSRAYRYDLSTGCRVYSKDGTYKLINTNFQIYDINGTPVTPFTPSDSEDLVNPYNDESGQVYGLFPANTYANWTANQQYKFQSDGLTFGGEGPNIKYTFFTKTYTGDDTLNTINSVCPFVNVTSVSAGGTTSSLYSSPSIPDLEHVIEGWDAIKNPLVSSTYAGFTRGEIYRVGIVAYNIKGQQSFVKWIGDIRIPEPWEDSDYDLTNIPTGGTLELKSIGIEFTIDTSSLPSDITGFRFVRVQRTNNDKTRFGTGVTVGLIKDEISLASAPLVTTTVWQLATKNTSAIPTDITLNNNFDTGILSPPDTEGTDILGVIKFPEFDFNKYDIGAASHIKRLSDYNITNSTTGDSSNIYWAYDFSGSNDYMYALANKLNTVTARSSDIIDIQDQAGVGIDGIILSALNANMGGLDFHNIASYNPDSELCSLGSKSLFCVYDSSMTGSSVNNYQVVSLCRFNQGHYGGPWRSSRYNNNYIASSDFLPIDLVGNTSQIIQMFGGDTFVNYYNTPLFFFHWAESYPLANGVTNNPSGLGGNYYPFAESMMALALCFPTESVINTDMRYGSYWNKDQVNQFQDTDTDTYNESPVFCKFLSDDYLYNDTCSQQNNVLLYVPEPFLASSDEENKVRVWASDQKIDREIIDSWTSYPVFQYTDLEGMWGEINRIINLKESLIAYQDRAICGVSSEELTTVPNGSGAVMQAGSGSLLARYDYISKDTGAVHQFSVTVSPSGVYHYDIRLNKLFRLQNGLEPLSDLEGLSAFFRNTVTGNIKITDKVLLGLGVHGEYDSMYNKCYFTFLNRFSLDYTSLIIPVAPDTEYILTDYSPAILQNILKKSLTFRCGTSVFRVTYIDRTTIKFTLVSGSVNPIAEKQDIQVDFTIAQNETLNVFEPFYSFRPSLYLGTGKRLLSANPYTVHNSGYVHDINNFGVYYDLDPSVSQAEFIVNMPDQTKLPTFRVDTIEFWSEVLDANGINIPLETITGIVLYNDYQTTGTSLDPLIIQDTVKARERTWRISNIWDYTDNTKRILPYLRDKYVKIRVYYDNALNRDFKLHEINTVITPSYH